MIFEDNIFFGDPRPRILHPVIKNPHLAVAVTIIIRDNENKETDETYETVVEQACRTCEYGALETHIEPCPRCFKQHTPERPYKMWAFNAKYNPCDENYV